MPYPIPQRVRYGVMGMIIGFVLAFLSIDSHGMSMKRGKATVQKSNPVAAVAAKPPAAKPFASPAAPRNPASSDPKGSEDRGIRDMGCNDQDRDDPSKPCKNMAPKPNPVPVAPVIPVVIATPAPTLAPPPPPPAGTSQACARFFGNAGWDSPVPSTDGAESEYRRIRDQSLALSDGDLTHLLMKEGIGACKLTGSRPQCPQCACNYYFQTRAGTWFGSGGWPINPASRASTGCVSNIRWGGYLPSMATGDLMKNAAEQARHALCHPADPCRIHPKNLGIPIHNSDVLDQ